MDDEAWLNDLEAEIASTKRAQLLAILRDLDMQTVTVVEVDRCTDPLGELSNAALTERYTAVISIPPGLFGEDVDDD
jgi:hypothetical protein